MSNVVVFRPERTGPVAIRRQDEPVQIFFFTGVRYIRDEAAPPPPEPVDPDAENGETFETERLKA